MVSNERVEFFCGGNNQVVVDQIRVCGVKVSDAQGNLAQMFVFAFEFFVFFVRKGDEGHNIDCFSFAFQDGFHGGHFCNECFAACGGCANE